MKPSAFSYRRPDNLAEALALLRTHAGDAKLIAGGQSLMPLLNFRLLAPAVLVDLADVPNLDRIDVGADGVTLGARVRWRDIERDERLAVAHPLLTSAVEHVAHYQIRNRGTVGGSLAHADPAAELPAVALACDADIRVAAIEGERTIAAADFFQGSLTTALSEDEIILAVRFPPWPRERRWAFLEFARRRGDFALAGVAASLDCDSAGRIVGSGIVGFGVSDRPVRLTAAEDVLVGRILDALTIDAAAEAAMRSVDPPSDPHAPAEYRRSLLGTLLGRALAAAVASRPQVQP